MARRDTFQRNVEPPIELTPARIVLAVVVVLAVVAATAGIIWAGVIWGLIQLWILWRVLQLQRELD